MENKKKSQVPIFLKYLKKSNITREITLIFNTHSNDRMKNGIKDEFFNGFEGIESNLIVRINEIIEICGINPVLVKVKKANPAIPRFGNNINDFFEEFSDTSNIRIIINFEKIEGGELDSCISQHPISHLVEISLCDHTEDDLNLYESPTATLYPQTKNLKMSVVNKINRIIEDVMLDICLYHTFIANHHENDIDFRKNFSYLKIAYAQKEKIANKRRSIWNTDKGKAYISLAGYFWEGNKFDTKSYVECWVDLRCQLFGKEIPILPITSQLQRHVDEKKLSTKKYVNMYNDLSSGQYFFARIFKKPNSGQLPILKSLFGGKVTPQIGDIKFFPYDRIKHFDKVKNCVSFFMVLK